VATASERWEPVQRLRTHEQVMAQIEQRILDGQLRPGDHLPSERELAVLLGVSRPSLRESLRVLEALGVVDIRRGGGSEGGAVLQSAPGTGLVSLLRLQLALAHFSWTDVLETRLALELWSAREAAHRSTEDDHRELAEILDRMDDPSIKTSEFNRMDAEFHVRISQSTGNALTAYFMGSLRSAIHHQMIEMYAELDDWRETAKTVRREHREILQAIVDRDEPLAAQRMQAHICEFYHLPIHLPISGSEPALE
jgi:GntR family transcriptional regulator, transcriptional repressor for pyruvate dehydrogenase complex